MEPFQDADAPVPDERGVVQAPLRAFSGRGWPLSQVSVARCRYRCGAPRPPFVEPVLAQGICQPEAPGSPVWVSGAPDLFTSASLVSAPPRLQPLTPVWEPCQENRLLGSPPCAVVGRRPMQLGQAECECETCAHVFLFPGMSIPDSLLSNA